MIVFDDMIVDALSNINFNPISSELFSKGRKLTIILVFITKSYLPVLKNVRLNPTHYFLTKIPNKRELQNIAFNHSSDIDFPEFMNLYKTCTAKWYSFLVTNTTHASNNFSRFRQSLLERT